MGGLGKKRNLSGHHEDTSRVNALVRTTECKQMDSGLQKLPFPVPSLWLMLLDHLPQGISLSQLGQGALLLHGQAGSGWDRG